MNDPKETAGRIRDEALALRYVLTLPEDERADAAGKLDEAALDLVGLVAAVARELRTAPRLGLVDVAAMMDRPAVRPEAERLRACGGDLLDHAKGFDPEALADAYARALADTQRAGELRRIDEAADLLTRAKGIEWAGLRRALLDDAAARIERAERATEGTLAEAWAEHLDNMAAPEAGPDKVLRLDAKRGTLAGWMNDYLGPRGGLEPGQTFILGGAPEAGKTSLAALLAVDALAVGCPVLFWQLELSREETLEHLQAQLPAPARWWTLDYWTRARRQLPAAWADLLTVPRWPKPEAESVEAALLDMARKAERAARAGKPRHACRGLAVVDYAQLLTVADAGPRNAQHEILATAASRLAKAAAESGACLLLLSQLNKADQRDGKAGGTALAAADLQRMAHRVALMQKADADGNACADGDPAAWDADKGEARLLTWTKARGVRYTPEGKRPDRARMIWNGGRSRALHGGDMDAAGRPRGFSAEGVE